MPSCFTFAERNMKTILWRIRAQTQRRRHRTLYVPNFELKIYLQTQNEKIDFRFKI